MNGFLPKPCTLAELRAAVARWLPAVPAPAAPQAAPAAPAADLRAIDPAAIAMLRELDDSGSMALVSQVLGSFIDSAPALLERMADALARDDAKALNRAAHSLKSSSANVGARALAACCLGLERCGRDGRLGEARPLLAKARDEQQRALGELRELLGELA